MSFNRQYREWPIYCRCKDCRDMLTIYLWVRKEPNGEYSGILEGSQDVKAEAGRMIHRPGHCGGELVAIEPYPGPTRLV